ncbi:MAG: hypothetical protein BGO59_08435 [Spirosoma sp. 48-14]|nr:MAG: hypothetical protein BGO59_08435 [Spirosoma sp. 48-14]
MSGSVVFNQLRHFGTITKYRDFFGLASSVDEGKNYKNRGLDPEEGILRFLNPVGTEFGN